MKKINLNIKNNDDSFVYLLEYRNNPYNIDNEYKYYKDDYRIDICPDNCRYIKYNNDWVISDNINSNEYLPTFCKSSNIRLYFPNFSVDTYKKTDYILTVNTWVNGKIIYLGSYVFNRIDALAVESPILFESNHYYEYVDIDIIDPWDIAYSDSWKEWRHHICGEPIVGDYENYNNTGSQINFTLYPVQYIDNRYMILDGYSGGQNGMNMASGESDYLSMHIEPDFSKDMPGISYYINFNKEYNGDIYEYLKETYGLSDVICKVGLAVNEIETSNDVILIEKEYGEEFTYNDLKKLSIFQKWIDENGEFGNGVMISGSLTIHHNNIRFVKDGDWYHIIKSNDEIIMSINPNSYIRERSTFIGIDIENHKVKLTYKFDKGGLYYEFIDIPELLYIISNSIPLTQELCKYFIGEGGKLDLTKINMNHYNITAVNKIENNIVKVDGINDSKSNIIQSVFVRVKDSQDLLIHTQVTENICINLDRYKSKVQVFRLKIEDYIFNQIGSTSNGIVFKVIGGKINNKKSSGIYYILDQNSELVTSGKYISVE